MNIIVELFKRFQGCKSEELAHERKEQEDAMRIGECRYDPGASKRIDEYMAELEKTYDTVMLQSPGLTFNEVVKRAGDIISRRSTKNESIRTNRPDSDSACGGSSGV